MNGRKIQQARSAMGVAIAYLLGAYVLATCMTGSTHAVGCGCNHDAPFGAVPAHYFLHGEWRGRHGDAHVGIDFGSDGRGVIWFTERGVVLDSGEIEHVAGTWGEVMLFVAGSGPHTTAEMTASFDLDGPEFFDALHLLSTLPPHPSEPALPLHLRRIRR